MRKTWKREVAAIGLTYVGAIGLVAIYRDSEMAFRVMEMTLAPVMLFAAGAWGFDAWTKQSPGKKGGEE